MTDILSMLSSSGRNGAAPQKSAQRMLMDRLAAADPEKAEKAQARIDVMEDAIRKMQQMRRDEAAQRKEAARQKIARIKAQIQAMKMAGGDPKAQARQLARLARELASAVREFRSGGATDVSAAVGTASAPATGAVAAQGDDRMAGAGGVQVAAAPEVESGQDGTFAPGPHTGDTAGKKEAADGKNGAQDEDREFAEEARRLQRQIKSMLEEARRRLAKEGRGETVGTQAVDAALREAERQTQALETPVLPVDIRV